MNEIVNRVANSTLVTIDLDNFYSPQERIAFDLKDFLFEGLILKEMEFRQSLTNIQWELYRGKAVAIYCSSDAILPTWAYLLVGSYLVKVTDDFVVGDLGALEQFLIEKSISKLNLNDFKDKSVVIKGCSKHQVPLYAYGKIISLIQPISKSIMYGEPCSTVPIYKRPK
jgi:hypothetical protein